VAVPAAGSDAAAPVAGLAVVAPAAGLVCSKESVLVTPCASATWWVHFVPSNQR
jgi:hypothetical protein